MKYKISIAENGNYVVIKYFAPMTTDIALKSGSEMVQIASINNINKFLFDLRKSSNTQSVVDNYYFAYNDIQTFDFPTDSRSAFLTKEGDNSHDFITTTFLNAGYTVKLFTDKSDAVNWLVEND